MRSVWVRVGVALVLAAGGIALIATGNNDRVAPTGEKNVSATGPKVAPTVERETAKKKPGAKAGKSKQAPKADKPQEERGEVIVRASWGSGANDLGHTRPSEGAPEGPMSFAIGADGSLALLDQVNSRLVVRSKDGVARTISLPADTYQDVEVDGQGGYIVLDRLASQTVTFLDKVGKVRHSIQLVGRGIEAGGMVSGLFARADGIWIEVEHRTNVRIADALGKPDPERPIVDGRFSSDGRWLMSAAMDEHRRVVNVVVRPAKGGKVVFNTVVRFPEPLMGIFDLDTDAAGRTILVAHTLVENPADPGEIISEHVVAVALGADGKEVSRRFLAVPKLPEEQFRPIRIAADGSVYQFILADNGATIERFGP